MATRIRLARGGKKKRPYYRIVVADSRAPRDGRFIERIGSYDPLLSENKVQVDMERAMYWLNVGAKPSERVSKLLATQGVEHKLVVFRTSTPKPAAESKAAAKEEAKAEAKDEAKDKDAAAAKAEAKDEAKADEKPAETPEAKADDAKAEDAAPAEAEAKPAKGKAKADDKAADTDEAAAEDKGGESAEAEPAS